MKTQSTALAAILLVFVVHSLATPPPRSRQEMERRRDARLAAARVASEEAAGKALLTLAQTHQAQSAQQGSLEPDAHIATNRAGSSGPKRIVIKKGGMAVKAKVDQTLSSSSASSSLPSSLRTDSDTSSREPPRHAARPQGTSSSSASQTSLSSADSDHIGKTTEKQHRAASSSSYMPKTKFIPDLQRSELGQRKQRQTYFRKVWEEHGLGTHMPAHALADGIKMMSAAGLDSAAAMILVGKKLQDAPSQAYRDAFSDRAKQWNTTVGNARKHYTARDPSFADLNEQTKREKMYLKASQTIDSIRLAQSARARAAKGLLEKAPLYGLRKIVTEENKVLERDIGRAFRQHLSRKGLNFKTMPIEQMEIESRDQGYPGTKPGNYTRKLLKYIGRYRSKAELSRYRDKRHTYNADKSKGKFSTADLSEDD